jgi:hypothetical protein
MGPSFAVLLTAVLIAAPSPPTNPQTLDRNPCDLLTGQEVAAASGVPVAKVHREPRCTIGARSRCWSRSRARRWQSSSGSADMFTLDQVVPWGRSFEEYCRMFALREDEMTRKVLGCGDGPASFNAEATRRGAAVISCDPIYRWPAADIRERIASTCTEILEQTSRNRDEFVWDSIRSVEELGRLRMAAMEAFLDDYEPGTNEGRYVDAALPALPFADRSFELALCSHLLFLYSRQLDEAFHHAAVEELRRVAGEVRIFPLIALGGERSPYVDSTIDVLRARGCDVTIDAVPSEFQRGANQMMRIRVCP